MSLARELRSFGQRLTAASVIASLLLLLLGRNLIGALLPLFEAVFSIAEPGFEASFHIESDSNGNDIITANAYTTEVVALDASHAVAPFTHLDRTVYMDLTHALIPTVILVAGLLAWPLTGPLEIFARAAFGLFGICLVLCVTTPPYLAGLVDQVVIESALGYGIKPSPYPSALRLWMIFMELGGLWLLPIISAIVSIHSARRLVARQAVPQSK